MINLNIVGWSRLSKKLLVETYNIDEYNNKLNIMDNLRNTNQNFMKIITNKDYIFKKVIEENTPKIESKKINKTFYEDNISTLMTSPANKRGIWQAIKLIDELVRYMGCEPKNIFVEFARSDEESTRTNSRKKKLEIAYKKLEEQYIEIFEKDIKNAIVGLKSNISDRLYLYLMQNGKCMYSGKKLEIDNLELYQVDHIIPQSKIKDDSFDNKVLVIAKENQKKLDGYIDDDIINNRIGMWKKLFDVGLISQIKYFNLINNKDTVKKIEGFIRRQLVETRQITKHVTNIIKEIYEDTEVFSIKANLAHDFRDKYDLYKIRDLNNSHHAKDAYINIVIGNFINHRYPQLLKEFKYSDYMKDFEKDTKNHEKNKYGFIVSNIGKPIIDKDTGEILNEEKEIKYQNNALKQLEIKDFYITKKIEEKSAGFYNQTIKSKEETSRAKSPIPLKENLDPLKYGSYFGEINSYNVLIRYNKKGKEEYQVVGIPARIIIKIKNDKKALKNYLEKTYGEVEILKNKIYSGQLIRKGNIPYRMVSSGEITIAKELRLNHNEDIFIHLGLIGEASKTKLMLKVYNMLKQEINIDLEAEYTTIDRYLNKLEKREDTTELKDSFIKTRKSFSKIIQEQALIKSYDILSKKIKEEYFDTIGEKLIKDFRDDFIGLDIDTKVKNIRLILMLAKGTAIDLKDIGGKSSQGRIVKINMNTNWLKDVEFIDESISGIFEKRWSIHEFSNNTDI